MVVGEPDELGKPGTIICCELIRATQWLQFILSPVTDIISNSNGGHILINFFLKVYSCRSLIRLVLFLYFLCWWEAGCYWYQLSIASLTHHCPASEIPSYYWETWAENISIGRRFIQNVLKRKTQYGERQSFFFQQSTLCPQVRFPNWVESLQ